MDAKKFIWVGVFVGSTVGSYIPSLWGAGLLSFSSIILGTVGALAGLWIGFKLGQ